jgi:F-type H+-transporting ATPase subunit epsilon
MYLEIVTPEFTVFKGEVQSVSVPGLSGDFEMLNNHAPIVSTLKEGYIKISDQTNLSEEQKPHFELKDNSYCYPVLSGAIELNANKVMVLVDA